MEDNYNVVACRPVAGQRPFLSKSFKNKHVSTATVGYNNNGNPPTDMNTTMGRQHRSSVF
jgi:hypothetical protein